VSLPSFTIEYDPQQRAVSIDGKKQQLFGSMKITLRRPGKPQYLVSFSTPDLTVADLESAISSLLRWADEQK
jgi:hypothetical protein